MHPHLHPSIAVNVALSTDLATDRDTANTPGNSSRKPPTARGSNRGPYRLSHTSTPYNVLPRDGRGEKPLPLDPITLKRELDIVPDQFEVEVGG